MATKFINAVLTDEDCPPDVTATVIKDGAAANFRRERDTNADQWQVAIDVSTSIDDAVLMLVEQHEIATDRLIVQQHKRTMDDELRRVQDDYRERVRGIKQAQKDRIETKRKSVKKRHAGKGKQ